MLIVQLLLPRFLVVEVVFFIHFIQGSEACRSKFLNKTENDEKQSDENGNEISKTCLIPLGKIDQEPLFYDLDGQYLLPILDSKSGQNVLKTNDKFLISCPSAKLSFLGDGKKDVMEIICVNQNQFKTKENQEISEYKSLSCSKSILESVQESQLKCGPNDGHGKIVHVGFKLPLFGFKTLYTVCHDRSIDHTYYSNHTIKGANIMAKSTGGNRPRFKESGFFTDVSANNAYNRNNQRSKILSKCHNCSFVARGHLSPRADFLFEEWQDATFSYINAVPQFQKFNAGNWALMEEAVRKLASKLKRNLEVQTGTLDIAKSRDQMLSLTENAKMPVPLFLWKLVFDPLQNKAIVFISLNYYARQESLCPEHESSLCEENSWDFSQRNQFKKGVLYCCSYQSLKTKIKWMNNYQPSGILNNIQD